MTYPTIERKGRKDRKDHTAPSACTAGQHVFAAFAAFAFLVISRPALAQSAAGGVFVPPPHVRPDAALRDMVDEATRRSPAIRALRAQLEASDVTVYIRTRVFTQADLDGHVALLAVNGAYRYLVIELSCARSTLSQMATLGHELFHAVEIAREPSVVDNRTLAALYTRIGRQTGDTVGRQTFETDAAANAGVQARRELRMNTTRSGHGS